MMWLDRALVVSPYYWCLCTTERLFHKALNTLKMAKSERPNFIKGTADATVHFVTGGKEGLAAIVCIKATNKSKNQVRALLVHEATHLWQEIREHLGEDKPSAEFEAYSIQMLSQRLFEAYAVQMKRKKRVSQPARKSKQRRK